MRFPPLNRSSELSSSTTIPAIRGTVTVNAPLDRAFEVFTRSFGSWWPADYHIGQADMTDAVIEPHEGGRWYEKCVDGSECDWGRVLVWEPPNRLVMTWQINGMWQFDDDPAHASEIEVRFIPEGAEQTTVDLEHRYLDRLVAGQGIYDAIGQGGSWKAILQVYAGAVKAG
jgi:uncharacterized protein YndB with AHSA1/START domain